MIDCPTDGSIIDVDVDVGGGGLALDWAESGAAGPEAVATGTDAETETAEFLVVVAAVGAAETEAIFRIDQHQMGMGGKACRGGQQASDSDEKRGPRLKKIQRAPSSQDWKVASQIGLKKFPRSCQWRSEETYR